MEQPEGAAVEIVHGDDVIAAVQQLQQGRGRRHARGKGEAARAGLEIGDAIFIRKARRVVRARVLEALVLARARLHVGRGLVDRRHDRASGRIRMLAGMNAASGETLLTLVVFHDEPSFVRRKTLDVRRPPADTEAWTVPATVVSRLPSDVSRLLP